MKKQRLIILDIFRGLAALIVLFHHFFKINKEIFIATFSKLTIVVFDFISELNNEAVLFFFILSGFSIGLSLKSESLKTSTVMNNYFYRRLKRILPIYWLSILAAFLSGIIMGEIHLKDYSVYNLIGNLLFLQTSVGATPAWFTPYGFNGPLWSLAFEFFFYWFFPIAYILNSNYFSKYSINIKFVVFLFVTLLSIIVNKILFMPFLLFFNSFLVWILGYLTSKAYLNNSRYNFIYLFGFLFGVFYFIFGIRLFHSNSIRVLSEGLIINALFYVFVIKNFTFSLTFLHNYLKMPFFQFIKIGLFKIGNGSYAIYALHYPLFLVMHYFNVPLLMQVFVVVFFLIFCVLIEEVSIKWKVSFLKINYAGIAGKS